MRASIVVQWIKLPLGMPTFHIPVAAQVLAPLLLTQFSLACSSDGPSTWVPDSHPGDRDRVPGSCVQTGPILAVAGICGANTQTEGLSFFQE